jgi:hypothetical protein
LRSLADYCYRVHCRAVGEEHLPQKARRSTKEIRVITEVQHE